MLAATTPTPWRRLSVHDRRLGGIGASTTSGGQARSSTISRLAGAYAQAAWVRDGEKSGGDLWPQNESGVIMHSGHGLMLSPADAVVIPCRSSAITDQNDTQYVATQRRNMPLRR